METAGTDHVLYMLSQYDQYHCMVNIHWKVSHTTTYVTYSGMDH